MTQSTNARPCNCDQALEAEEQRLLAERRASINFAAYDREADRVIALQLTTAAQDRKLSAVTRILCDLVSAPSLSVAQFADPTLERIRLAMLGRTG